MSSNIGYRTFLLSDSGNRYESMDTSSSCYAMKKDKSLSHADFRKQINSLRVATMKPGVYSTSYMEAAGFKYTGNGDTARCEGCGLEVSGWTLDMKPFEIHRKQRPDCSFVQSIIGRARVNSPSTIFSSTTAFQNTSQLNEQERPSKRLKIETVDLEHLSNTLLEVDLLQQVRRRTFSHWPHRTIPSGAQMIEAGFFNCNVGDRVMCIYCNIICQQWTPDTDDPCEVHKTLSPDCIYVKAKLIRPSASSILIVNEGTTITTSNNQLSTSTNLDPLRSEKIDFTAACNPAYAELPKRQASFVTWSNENLPPVDDLVRAGFFYTGTKDMVTCFYCNGSLQNWSPNDNPMVEHARWFPHCAYAKQLCGEELYRKIQELKRGQQKRARVNEMEDEAAPGAPSNANTITNSRQLLIPNESILSRYVAARLDLPASQRLLRKHFRLSIIKKCLEDQLRLKKSDFVSDCDFYVACLILQKQIEGIDGKKENIIIPSVQMKQIRVQEEVKRKGISFPEKKEKTMEREKSLHHWPHSSPSPRAIFLAGWSYDEIKGRDCTKCTYCGAEYNNWQPTDNPWTIHEQLSPFCPFLYATCPMSTNSVCIKDYESMKMTSDVILPSISSYALPPKREESFRNFPGECPSNMNALVNSGFYYTGTATTIQCYDCRGTVNDFHRYPSNEINTRHHTGFPRCRFAQLLPQPNERTSTNRSDLCNWCLVNPKEMVIYPCLHLVVCGSCTQWTNLCSTCGIEGQYFMKFYP